MHRRYTIHRDGDLLVEDLDDAGQPLSPEPVAPEDRLAVEVVVRGPDSEEGHAQLLELLEAAYGLQTEGLPPSPEGGGHKLPVVD
jgi:hypothetical protein